MTLNELDNSLCTRCLIIVNAKTSVGAYKPGNLSSAVAWCQTPTDPRLLRRWVEEQMWGNGHVIAIDAMPYAFACVGTWQGDAMCSGHLVDVRWWEHRK